MEQLTEDVKKTVNNLKMGKATTWLGVTGVIIYVILAIFFPMISSFAAIIGNSALGLLVLAVIDKYVLGGVNTEDEIKKGNVAYALMWLAFALVIMGSIIAT